jgi:hypothetical protein
MIFGFDASVAVASKDKAQAKANNKQDRAVFIGFQSEI